MSARFLLVDGHSVIFAWTHLRELHARNRASARRELEEQLRQMHDSTSWRITLVFDGTMGSPAAPVSHRPEEMVVLYGHADQTADSIIEKIVASAKVEGQIVVVTADRAEQSLVESLGATTYTPAWLQEEMAREGETLRERLAQIHRGAKWKR